MRPTKRVARPEPRGGHRLVGTLAARDPLQLRVGDGLARARQPLAAGHEVDVRRADDGDAGSARSQAADLPQTGVVAGLQPALGVAPAQRYQLLEELACARNR